MALGFHAIFESIEPIDAKTSAGGFEDAHEEAEKRGFASAVGSQEAADLTGWDFEREIADGTLAAEVFCDVIDCDDESGARVFRVSRCGGI